jgi:hypothetical protein
MNVELLRKARDRIEADHSSLDMSTWFYEVRENGKVCKTVACIAGHVCLAADAKPARFASLFGHAQDLLELGYDEAMALFMEYDGWPEEYRTEIARVERTTYSTPLEKSRQKQIAQAKGAVRLLDKIIERGEIWWVGQEEE